MSTSIAGAVARLSQRGLCVAAAWALTLACIGLVVSASASPMPDMAGMADGSTTGASAASPAASSGAAAMDIRTVDAGAAAWGEAASPLVAPVESPPRGSMCDSMCVTDVIMLCLVASGLSVLSLLALAFATRRDTFLGLCARTGLLVRGRPRHRPPWTVHSLISLCVLRV